jgi:cytochrome P450
MSEAWHSTPLSSSYSQWILTGILGIAVFLAFLAAKWVAGTLRPKDFPPGPPVIPGLGNLHQMPIQKPYLKFHEWSKEYGDIVGLKVGTGNLVLLNTPELVHELFNKRGAICSNRPFNYILTNHIHSDPEEKGITILQYDEYYRRWRKSLQFILGAVGIRRLLPLLEAEASDLCRKFLDGGQNYMERVVHWAMAVPLVATTGERLNDQPSDYAKNTIHAQESLLELILPGAAPPVDVFPILRYVPEFLASWKSKARRARKIVNEDANKYLVAAKRTYEKVVRKPDAVGFDSLLPKVMMQQASGDEKTKFTDTELAFIGQAAIGAAIDTTAGTFQNLMVAFASHPAVLAKAQEEIDRCVGDVPPQGEKINELVYLRACVSEVRKNTPMCVYILKTPY